MDEVRLALAMEEKARTEAGIEVVHTVSAAAFVLLGLEIQTLQ